MSPLMDPASTGRLAPGDTKEPEEVDDDEYGSFGVPVAPLVTVLEPEPPAAAGVSVPEARALGRQGGGAEPVGRLPGGEARGAGSTAG